MGAVAVQAGGRKAFELGRWTLWFLVACIVTPFLANTFGWLFTEMGRQLWIVYGLMKTGAGISPGVSTADVAFTLGGFVLLHTVLGVIDVVLMFRAARGGLGDAGEPRLPGQPGHRARRPGRLLGGLHRCLITGQHYDEDTAFPTTTTLPAAA